MGNHVLTQYQILKEVKGQNAIQVFESRPIFSFSFKTWCSVILVKSFFNVIEAGSFLQ